jgi:hypothetical protein
MKVHQYLLRHAAIWTSLVSTGCFRIEMLTFQGKELLTGTRDSVILSAPRYTAMPFFKVFESLISIWTFEGVNSLGVRPMRPFELASVNPNEEK